MAIPPVYTGRNSVKDLANRQWDVEDTKLPALQSEVDAVDQRLDEETDIPDLTLVLNNALT